MTSVFYFALTFFMLVATCQGQNYVAEGYFVVDDKAVQVYVNEISGSGSYATKRAEAVENMKKDIDYILSETNTLMGSLSASGLNIEIKLRDLKILDENIFLGDSIQDGLYVTSNTGLGIFKTWLQENNAFETLKYDFAILWTGFDLYGSTGNSATGYAHVGKICDEELSIGMVEFNATYGTSIVTAHELGHILGTNHGGAASQHIMASHSSPAGSERWSFSQCAASNIKDYIALLSPNCLLDTNPSSETVSMPWSSYTGQMFDPDVVCRRTINNSESYACRAASLYEEAAPHGDIVCQKIYCRMPGTNFCSLGYPSDGMVCDTNKRCNDGKCQPDTSVASRDADPKCLWGDEQWLTFDNIGFSGTCGDFTQQYGKAQCYNSLVSSLCCKTCKNLSSGIAGCEYGDKSTQCVYYSKSGVCPLYGSDLCCGYCKGYVGKRSIAEEFEFIVLQDEALNQLVEPQEYAADEKDVEVDEEDD